MWRSLSIARCRELLLWSAAWCLGVLRVHLFACSFLAACCLIALWLVVVVLIPAYRSPSNSTYDSKFGAMALQRKLGRPFAVTSTVVTKRPMPRRFVGEGLLASEPVQVPIVPLATIKAVHVQKGDFVRKGQLLVELEDAKQQIKIRSAECAVKTSKAELERVMIGSAYVLAQERPTKDQINLDAAKRTLEILKAQLKAMQSLQKSGGVSTMAVYDLQKLVVAAEQDASQGEFNLGMSSRGQDQSRLIAQTAITESQNALDSRTLELRDYKIYAPADGVVTELLVHPGEYNQDTGRAGLILASGLWFEAHFSQAMLSQVRVGDSATVFMEAYPGTRFSGRIERIIPVVTPSGGGPETTRPMRPMGSGAPEWPCTFVARILLDPQPQPPAQPQSQSEAQEQQSAPILAPGLTGFARIESMREVVCVPRKSLLSDSGGQGFVHVLHPKREIRPVKAGAAGDEWVEIISGITPGEVIVLKGFEGLLVTDKLAETTAIANANAKDNSLDITEERLP